MPVDYRTNQPYGLLHGGASCVLAETLGSVASALIIDHLKIYLRGNRNQCQSYPERKEWLCSWYCDANTYWVNDPCMGYKDQ